MAVAGPMALHLLRGQAPAVALANGSPEPARTQLGVCLNYLPGSYRPALPEGAAPTPEESAFLDTIGGWAEDARAISASAVVFCERCMRQTSSLRGEAQASRREGASNRPMGVARPVSGRACPGGAKQIGGAWRQTACKGYRRRLRPRVKATGVGRRPVRRERRRPGAR